MGKFLNCGLIAAFAILPITIKVCAEPPPAEPVVISHGSPSEKAIEPDVQLDESIDSQKQTTVLAN